MAQQLTQEAKKKDFPIKETLPKESDVLDHFLPHRAGDNSPGPRGEPPDEAEVWIPTSRVRLGHGDDDEGRLCYSSLPYVYKEFKSRRRCQSKQRKSRLYKQITCFVLFVGHISA